MATWKRAAQDGHPQYYFLCGACDEEQAGGLDKGGWRKIREGEPARCNACALPARDAAEGTLGRGDARSAEGHSCTRA